MAIQYSGDIRVDALISYSIYANWNYTVSARPLKYTFDMAGVPLVGSGMAAFNADQQAAASAILSYAGVVTGITFQQVAANAEADIHFAATNIPGYMGYEISYSTDAYVYLDNFDYAAETTHPAAGDRGYQVLLHEVGHALGLGHPFDGPYFLDGLYDNTDYTVMSYLSMTSYKSTFQEYDLLALRWLYGADGIGGHWGFNSVNGPSLTLVVDHDAPRATGFSPADEATGVAIEASVVVAFSEPIVRGTGTIVLKTASGTVVETYDAATSTNLAISGSTLSIDPGFDLAKGTSYIVEIAGGAIQDQAHNAYAGIASYNFTTLAPDVPTIDATGPSVAQFEPRLDEANVAVATNIIVQFSKPIFRGTGAIVLKTSAGAIIESFDVATSAKLSVSNGTVTIDPSTDLAINTTYKLEFATGNFRDAAGNASHASSSYHFTTVAPDVTAPVVTGFNPLRTEKEVPVNTDILVIFSEVIARGVGAVVLRDAQGAVVEIFDAAVSPNLTFLASELIVNPSADLLRDGTYSLEVGSGAILDLSGNAFAGTLNYSFSTATGPAPDTTGPVLMLASPADEANGVEVDANVVLTFDEPIKAGTGVIQIKIPGFGVVGTYSTSETRYVTISGNKLTFNPPFDLLKDMIYQVTFESGSVKDLSGNGIAAITNYNFKTVSATNLDISPPIATAFIPADEAKGVSVDSNMAVRFNESIVRGSGSIVLKDTAGTLIESFDAATSARVSISGSELTINPSADLDAGIGYSLLLPSGSVRDAAGNDYAGTVSYNFSTFAAAQMISGTTGVDVLAGGPGDDTIYGLDGDDSLTGGTGDDSLHGDVGRDTALFAGARAQYSVSNLYGLHTITGLNTNDDRDILIDVERARFADSAIAFDTGVSEHAGETALLIGATLGSSALAAKPDLVGAVLGLMDAGYSMQALSAATMRLPVWEALAGGNSSSQIATYLLTTVAGRAPDAATLAAAVSSIDSDPQGDFLWHLAQSATNQTQVNLVGLAQSGLEYV